VKQFFGMIWAWLLGRFEFLADLVKGLVQDFRESNRAFKVKVGLIGGYVAVSAATLIVFIPPGEQNDIDAVVRISKAETIGGRFVTITNQSAEDWTDLSLTMNGTFVARWRKLGPGKKKAFFFNAFKDASGKEPASGTPVTRLRIDCAQGYYDRDLIKHPSE
jgi:hypothetical protein